MSNRPIILRLSNEDASDVQVDIAALQALLVTLSEAFSAVAHIAAPPRDTGATLRVAPESTLRMLLVAPPRRACLELVFVPEFVLNFDLNIFVGQFHEGHRENLSDIASVGRAILEALVLLYGFWRRQTPEPPMSPWLKEFMPILIKRAKEDGAAYTRFSLVRRASMKLGSHKVELSLEEKIEVELSDASDRARSIAVGGNKFTAPPGELIPEGKIECTSDPAKVMFEGKEYEAFCARPTANKKAGTIVVVWGSENAIPGKSEQSVVRFTVIEDPDVVQVIGEPPGNFATANGAIFVSESQSGFR